MPQRGPGGASPTRDSMEAGYTTDLARIPTPDLTEEERAALQADLDSLFQPREDPGDLSKELQIMAEQHLGETPDLLRQNLRRLKELVQEEENLNARTDDLFLAAFLRGRKHDVDKAFQCLKNFYDFKARYPDLYCFLYPSKNPEVYDQNHFGSLPGTDRKGRKICAIVPAHVDMDIPMMGTYQLAYTVLETMLMDLRLQVAGTCLIFDMGNFSLMQQARLVTPTLCWHMAIGAQDKIPMRLKAIHIINQPFYFNAIHAIFKTLLKKKLRKRMFLHGTDMASLHKHIAPENLPEEWGGTRPPFTSKLTKTLLHLNEHKFDEWKDKGYKH